MANENGASNSTEIQYHDHMDYSTMNLSDFMTLWVRLDDGYIALICLLYIPTMLIGIIGNGYLIYLVLVTPTLRSATNFFMANMALSDLLLVTLSPPIYIVKFSIQGYVMGSVVCKLQGFLQVMFMLASALSIVVISIDRFRGIVYPFSRRLSKTAGVIIICVIWAAAILFAVPLPFFRIYTERQWADYLEKFCGEDIAMSRTYWLVMLIIVVYIPVAAVTFAYTFIILQLEKYEKQVKNREHPSKAKNRRKVSRMLFIILMVHVLSWMPFETVIFYRNYVKSHNTCVSEWYKIVDFIAHYLAYTNGASNPFIYGASNDNYRKAFFKRFPFLQRRNRVVPTTRSSYLEQLRLRQEKQREEKEHQQKLSKPNKNVRMLDTVSTIHIPD